MGSTFELNDTLQITREQGFPQELALEKHLEHPYTTADFQDQIFSFSGKSGIRLYQIPPVRVFLVENKNGKWIYWGLAHIVEITHDYEKGTTSGKFRIIYINTPEEMKKVHDLVDKRKEQQFFQ